MQSFTFLTLAFAALLLEGGDKRKVGAFSASLKNHHHYQSLSSAVPVQQQQRQQGQSSQTLRTLLQAHQSQSQNDDEDDFFKDELQSLDEARVSFEALLRDPTTAAAAAVFDEAPLLLLTSCSQQRRRLELELLHDLSNSDEAIDELIHLWMSESNDANIVQALQDMEEHCSDGLIKEQRLLTKWVAEYPTWADAKLRLATLLFYKGETQASLKLALEALRWKPWHFELYPLLTMLALRQQEFGQALHWARLGLPPLTSTLNLPQNENYGDHETTIIVSQRRKDWVARAVQQATEQWEQAEASTRDYFQKLEQQQQQSSKSCSKKQQQEEVWQ